MARGRTKRLRRDEPTRDTLDRNAQEIERLREENDRLRKLLEEYAKRIADLERQLALKQQNSTITSKPPSSDGLAGHQRERGRREKSRRKAGGQPGHPGRYRELVPLERVGAIVDLAPEACRHCARRLHARHSIGEPRRHQVTELPPIAAHITEYRCHRRQCPDCGTITLAPLPDEHTTQFGPQLTALIAYLTVVCRMPRLVVQRFLEGALQIPISLGSTQNAWEETSAAVAAPYAELEAAVPQEPVINADETGHRTNGDKRWLWTFVARPFVLYRIAASRGSDVLQTVLGETFAGILGSDRLPAYLKYGNSSGPLTLGTICTCTFCSDFVRSRRWREGARSGRNARSPRATRVIVRRRNSNACARKTNNFANSSRSKRSGLPISSVSLR
jgi:transposase